MIDVKDAAKTAMNYFTEIFKDVAYSEIALEEIDRTGNALNWLITIGFTLPGRTSLLGAANRQYKIIEIDGTTSEIISMKIREV